jgi:hypothetical protein
MGELAGHDPRHAPCHAKHHRPSSGWAGGRGLAECDTERGAALRCGGTGPYAQRGVLERACASFPRAPRATAARPKEPPAQLRRSAVGALGQLRPRLEHGGGETRRQGTAAEGRAGLRLTASWEAKAGLRLTASGTQRGQSETLAEGGPWRAPPGARGAFQKPRRNRRAQSRRKTCFAPRSACVPITLDYRMSSAEALLKRRASG